VQRASLYVVVIKVNRINYTEKLRQDFTTSKSNSYDFFALSMDGTFQSNWSTYIATRTQDDTFSSYGMTQSDTR